MKDAPKQEVKTSNGVVEKDYTLAESMRKPQYWMLAVMFLTACMSGLYVIGVAKDIAQSLAHLDGFRSQCSHCYFHRQPFRSSGAGYSV